MNYIRLFLFVFLWIMPKLSTALALTNKIVNSKSAQIADDKFGARKMIRFAHEKIYNPTFDDLVVLDRAVEIGDDLCIRLCQLCVSSGVGSLALCALDFVKEKKIWENIAWSSTMLAVGCVVANKKINALRRTYGLPPRPLIVEKA